MAVAIRAITYATLFISIVLVYLPGQALARTGVTPPSRLGVWQLAGGLVTAAGGILAASCIATFAVLGRGTPAPFDPPRRLVVAGPYQYVRNPMYLGAAAAVAGAGLYYQTSVLIAYAAVFLLAMHVFVTSYEEPVLRNTFGDDYAAYCQRVHRWRPRFSR